MKHKWAGLKAPRGLPRWASAVTATVGTLVTVFAVLTAPLATVRAQEDGAQYVDSLERQQRRIEGLISERLQAMVPSGSFVLRATVEGSPAAAELTQSALPSTLQELPGFRVDQTQIQAQPQGAANRYKVDRIVINIVLKEQISASDQQYIRTIVPILADFDRARGDVLELRLIPPSEPTAQPEAAQAAVPEPRAPAPARFPPEGEKLYGLSTVEWMLMGLLGLILLILLVVMFRVLFLPKPKPAPLPIAAPAPRPPPEPETVNLKEMEEERQRIVDGRRTSELRHSVIKRMFARPELGADLVEAWKATPAKLNGIIHGLGHTIARQAILPHVGREVYQDLEHTVMQEKEPSAADKISALQDANLFLITQELVHPEEFRPNPFGFLDELSWGQTAFLIKDEPVKIKAIVLSRINPADTARILETLPKEMQLEIAVQIGNLHDMPLDMAESVAMDLAEKSRHVPDARLVEVEGPRALVNLMGRTTAGTSRYLLTAMRAKDRKLSEEVERMFFLFDSLPLVPDNLLPQAVRTMPSSTVIIAIQGADQDLQRKVIMAFPEQARPGLVNAVKASRAEPEAVEDARRAVVAKFQEMADQGRINLKEISDAWQARSQAS